jgi:hypothetical protein
MCCGVTLEAGLLCRSCAFAVAPCEGLIPEHIRSRVEAANALAWVIDGFGGGHALGATTSIGRNQDGDLVVLAPSVSREHAQLRRSGVRWILRDLGSRNGSFVDGIRIEGEVELPVRTVLKFGDVALWFVREVFQPPPARPEVGTAGMYSGLVRYQLVHGNAELCIVAGNDTETGGALLWRTVGAEAWSERRLAPLEFQLLRALLARAFIESASPSTVRGCVPSKQLARELPFQSKYANQENVRQIVLRVRTVLADVGADGVLAIAPGRGYYLASKVTATVVERQ